MEIELACGHKATEGSEVFSHYTMKSGTIARIGDDGWFSATGSLLNGERCMCLPCGDRYWPEQRSRA